MSANKARLRAALRDAISRYHSLHLFKTDYSGERAVGDLPYPAAAQSNDIRLHFPPTERRGVSQLFKNPHISRKSPFFIIVLM